MVMNVIQSIVCSCGNFNLKNLQKCLKLLQTVCLLKEAFPRSTHQQHCLVGIIILKCIDVCVKAGWRIVRHVNGVFLKIFVLQLVLWFSIGGVVPHVLEQGWFEMDDVFLGNELEASHRASPGRT